MPPAARITDLHTCPIHGSGPISSGCGTVSIGFQPAARLGDTLVCAGSVDAVAAGAANVFIGHLPAARVGDATIHGGQVSSGCPTVNIGSSAQASALAAAAASGTPLCEDHARTKTTEQKKKAPEKPPPDARVPAGSTTEPNAPPGSGNAPIHAPTREARTLANTPGSSLEQRVAREEVVRDFYERSGLGQARADADLGVGGRPPRANGSPLGFGIDLAKPLSVVTFPPPKTMDQFVRIHRSPGSFFDPIGGQPGDALGLNADPLHRKPATFAMPSGEGLRSTAGPILETWTDETNPVLTRGGGVQMTVSQAVKKAVLCVRCRQNRCTC